MDEWVRTFAYKQKKSATVSVKATGRERNIDLDTQGQFYPVVKLEREDQA